MVALNGVRQLDAGSRPAHDDRSRRSTAASRRHGTQPRTRPAARCSWFCNDDVELGAGSLARLAGPLLGHPHAAIVGPVGSRWDLVNGTHTAWVRPGESSRAAPAECDVVSGFLFACRREIWEEVGGFDEFYAPASWEEVDFCTAVRATG